MNVTINPVPIVPKHKVTDSVCVCVYVCVCVHVQKEVGGLGYIEISVLYQSEDTTGQSCYHTGMISYNPCVRFLTFQQVRKRVDHQQRSLADNDGRKQSDKVTKFTLHAVCDTLSHRGTIIDKL